MRKYIETDQRCNFPSMDFSGWSQGKNGEGSGGLPGRIAQTTPKLRSPEQKQRRLSELLNKLSVHLRNNNQYPPNLHLPQSQCLYETLNQEHLSDMDEAPLDLSMKTQKQPATQNKEPRNDSKFPCASCSQAFSKHDHLAKHMASRHRNKAPDSVKMYKCKFCNRGFTRSDMLTRHTRVHTGVKPYACKSCNQVFTRSDHLTTHERTHTGEKPYRCTVCPYAACRRDMITRHMKTHTKRLP